MFDNHSGLDSAAALAFAASRRRTADRAEAELLAVAAHWADLHAVLPGGAADGIPLDGMQRMVPLAGDGTPEVAEFAPAELGAALGMTTYAAQRLVGDALELRHRLPRLWARVHDHEAPHPLQVWRARRIAEQTTCLCEEAAAAVDAEVAPVAHKIGIGRTMQLVEAAMIRFDPEEAERRARSAAEQRGVWLDRRAVSGTRGIRIEADALDASAFDAAVAAIAEALAEQGDTDLLQVRRAKAVGYLADPDSASALLGRSGSGLDRRRSRVTLYVHLSEDAVRDDRGHVGRVEGLGPVTVGQIRAWVGNADVRITPVRDLADTTSVDGYETPERTTEIVLLRNPCCPFPWCDNLSRTKDMEHIVPYVPPDDGGPPGQTAADKLAGVCRRHHRLKTHGGWTYSMPEPGLYLWRSPTGRRYLVDHTGTTPLADAG